MKVIFGRMHPFLMYFMIIFFMASYSLFKQDGIISVVVGKNLFFVFWMIVLLVLNFVASFMLETFFVGEFFKKLKISVSTLLIGMVLYLLIYNVMDRGVLYEILRCVILLVIAYSFYDTFGELMIAENVLFDVGLKFLFWQAVTYILYSCIKVWKGIEVARLSYAGFFCVTLFLLLSLFRYIPNVVFESFSKNLTVKYCIGCLLYIYIVFLREKLMKNNFINIAEWIVICAVFVIYFYGVINNIKNVSYNDHDSIWGKHKQMQTIIRNEEFSHLTEYINEFIERGEKTPLMEFLFSQLFRLNLGDNDIKDMMYGFIEYKDINLPRYSSRSKLMCIINQNKQARYLIVESTMQKFNKVMEEKI